VFVFLNTKEVDGSKNLGISMPRGSERVKEDEIEEVKAVTKQFSGDFQQK
jgi:hypothetical protein